MLFVEVGLGSWFASSVVSLWNFCHKFIEAASTFLGWLLLRLLRILQANLLHIIQILIVLVSFNCVLPIESIRVAIGCLSCQRIAICSFHHVPIGTVRTSQRILITGRSRLSIRILIHVKHFFLPIRLFILERGIVCRNLDVASSRAEVAGFLLLLANDIAISIIVLDGHELLLISRVLVTC